MDPPEEEAIGDEDHILKAKRLQDTLKEFKIEVEMGEVHTGPVITRYDLHPAAGVAVEKIANLRQELSHGTKRLRACGSLPLFPERVCWY